MQLDTLNLAHEAHTRADNAEREYARACGVIETQMAEIAGLKQQLADTPHNSPETATE